LPWSTCAMIAMFLISFLLNWLGIRSKTSFSW